MTHPSQADLIGESSEAATFICAKCRVEFEREWSDAEAREEAVANGFGELPLEEMIMVCDDCYHFLMWFNAPS